MLLTNEFKNLEKKVLDSQDLMSAEPPFWLMIKIDDLVIFLFFIRKK